MKRKEHPVKDLADMFAEWAEKMGWKVIRF